MTNSLNHEVSKLRKLVSKLAISQVASLAIVVIVIVAGLGGYAFGHFNQPTVTNTQSGLTITESGSTVTVVVIEQSGSTATLTEVVVWVGGQTVSYTVSGSCTLGGGLVLISFPTASTTYIVPTNMTGYYSVTITTVSSTIINEQHVTTTLNTTNNTVSTTGCPTFG